MLSLNVEEARAQKEACSSKKLALKQLEILTGVTNCEILRISEIKEVVNDKGVLTSDYDLFAVSINKSE